MTKVAKVAVIGAGPAGMFAAQRLHTAGIDVVVFEAGEDLDTRKCPDQHCPLYRQYFNCRDYGTRCRRF